MTIVIENGTEVTGANSYATEAELAAYAAARGVSITADTEQLLIRAMDYIEAQSFAGIKSSSTQPLQWPRYDVVLDCYLINSDAIPQLLKDAQMEAALAIDAGEDPLANIPRTKKRASVGSISVEYTDGAAATTIVRKITAKLSKLLTGGGSGFRVSRG